MGSSSSNPFSKDLQNYTIEGEDLQNNLRLIKHIKNSQQFMIKETSYNDERQFDKKMDVYQFRRKMEKSQHLTLLVRLQAVKEDHLCSHFHKIYAMWEYPHRSLRQEIDDRILHQQRFQEKQLWSILASCILGLSNLQRNGIKHETLQTKTLLLGIQGYLKIADPLCLSSNTNFQTMYNNRQTKDIYLSPEQGAQLNATTFSIPSSSYKSDVFTIGIILLECGLLRNQNNCYREDGARIDWGIIGQNLNQFSKYYQQGLRSAIQAMLRRDHRERPDWLDLQKHVKKIQGQDSIDMDISQFQKNKEQSPKKQIQIPKRSISEHKTGTNRQLHLQSKNHNIDFYHLPQPNYYPLPSQPQNTYNYQTIQPIRNPVTNLVPYPVYNSRIPIHVSTQAYHYQHSMPLNYQETNTIHRNSYSGTKNKISSFTPAQKHLHHQQGYSSYPLIKNTPQSINSTNYPIGLNEFNYTHQTLPNRFPNSDKYKQKIYPEKQTNFQFTNYQKLGIKPKINLRFQGKDTRAYSNQNKLSFTNTHYSPILNYQTKTSNYQINQQNIPFINDTSNYQSFETSNSIIKNNINNPVIDNVTTILSLNGPKQIFNRYSPNKNNSNSPLKSEKNLQTNQESLLDVPNSKNLISSPNRNNQGSKIQIYHNSNFKKSINPPEIGSSIQSSQMNIEGLEYIVENFEQGSRYEGTKLNGMRHGKGKFYYQDGGLYDGQWNKNKMHGYGCLYYQSSKIAYEGYWNYDQFQGEGKLYNQNPFTLQQAFDYSNFDLIDEFWLYYQGQFDEDLKQGRGKMVLSNGQNFVGNFENDMINGQGWYSCLDGKIVHGYWQNNQLAEIFSD